MLLRIKISLVNLSVVVLFSFITAGLYAQIPVIQWQRTIGGNGNDRLQSVQQTTDGGYILGGYSTSGVSGEKTVAGYGEEDYWIVKLDAVGNIEWQTVAGGVHIDILLTVIQTADGGYLASGWSVSGVSGNKTAVNHGGTAMVGNASNGRDIWVVKLSASGVIQWDKTFGGSSYDMGWTLWQHPDGGYVIGGLSHQGGGGNKSVTQYGWNDYWVLKTDATGNAIQWQTSYGGSSHDGMNGLSKATAGGYIMGGSAMSGTSGSKTSPVYGGEDNWVVKTNASGAINWQITLGGSGYDAQVGGSIMSGDNGILQTADSGYLVGNTSNSPVSGTKTVPSLGGNDFWIVKLDTFGNIQWQEVYGGTDEEYLGTVLQTTDNGYLFAGHSASGATGNKTVANIGDKDWWIIKTDVARNVQWQMALGGTDADELMTVRQTMDGGYIAGGYSRSGISGNKTESNRGDFDYWIVKLGPCDTTPTRIAASFCWGDEYHLPGGQGVSSPGVYYDTLRNVWNTCDSVVITSLSYYNDNVHLLSGNVLGPDTAFCADAPYTLRAAYPGATYLWNTGDNTSTFDVTTSGSYSVTITSANGCMASDTVAVTVYEIPVTDLGGDRGICDRDTPLMLQANQPAGYQILWNNGRSDTEMRIVHTGSYWLRVRNNGCQSSDTVHITVVRTPEINIGSDSVICEQFPLRIGDEVAAATYLWNTGATTPYILADSTADYILSVNLNGCIVQDTVAVTAMPPPDIDLGGDRDICPRQVIPLDAFYTANSYYLWHTGHTSAVLEATSAGMYHVTVTSEYGCTGSDSVLLTHYPEPVVSLGEDTTVCEETPLQLKAWHINADSLIWSDGATGNTLFIRHGGQYIVTGINKCGTGADTIQVKQIFCEIWVPNAFTPNNDGSNDVFKVLGNTGRLEGFGLGIYNRWGERIFYTRDKYKGWDGHHNGREVLMGTYVYVLEYHIAGVPYLRKGNFHLLR